MIRNLYPMRKHLSPQQCAQILRECQRAGEYESSLMRDFSKEGYRRSSSIHVPRNASRMVFNNIIEMFYAANRFYGFHVFDDVQLELLRYDSDTKDRFKWHVDDLPDRDLRTDRKLSMSIQLSDPSDYDGCDLEISGIDNLDIRDQGSVLIFPSYMKHRVTKCTRGTRHVLVAWLYGPEWR